MTGASNGCVSILGSSTGRGTLCSNRSSRASVAAAPTPRITTVGESQPLLPPSVRNSTRQASPTNASAAPRRSKRCLPSVLYSARIANASRMVMRVRGTPREEYRAPAECVHEHSATKGRSNHAQRGYGGHQSQCFAALIRREYAGYQRGSRRGNQPVANRLHHPQSKHERKRRRKTYQEHRERISRQPDDVETTQAINVGSAAQSEVEACAAADIQHDYPLNGAEVRAQVGCDVWQGDIDRKVERAEEHAQCCRDQPEPLVRCLD